MKGEILCDASIIKNLPPCKRGSWDSPEQFLLQSVYYQKFSIYWQGLTYLSGKKLSMASLQLKLGILNEGF